MTRVRMNRLLVVLLLSVVVTVPTLAQLPRDLEGYIEQVRQDMAVVGLAVAVVKDDSVVYAKGFGLRELGRPELVDQHSLFAIGSNSKAFTAAAIGILVDEGRMSWDDRVVEHLPWFRLYDPYVTQEITVRDLLSHRSGLGRRGDANWYGTDFDREEIVRRIRFLEPNSSFRSEAGYQNTMFLAAGMVVEAETGMTWDDFIKSRIFQPLGMTRSKTSTLGLPGDDNVASPHHKFADGVTRPIPHRNLDNVAPAGSIYSSVWEMTHWLRLMLGEGEYAGQRILSDSVVREVHSPDVIYPMGRQAKQLFPSTHFSLYGLGWGLRDYQGRLLATHTGGIDGMLSQVMLVPEEELGVVVLTNTTSSGSSAHNAITYYIVDAYLGAPAKDWKATFLELEGQQRQAAEAALQRRVDARAQGTRPSLPLAEYAGTYEDDMYGTATVAVEDGRLVLRRHHSFVGDLEHWHYDTFVTKWRDLYMSDGPGTPVTFVLGSDGKVAKVEVENVAEFTRVREPASGETSP
jgi:CubicO group peptidase (beta-lactamase class C family)